MSLVKLHNLARSQKQTASIRQFQTLKVSPLRVSHIPRTISTVSSIRNTISNPTKIAASYFHTNKLIRQEEKTQTPPQTPNPNGKDAEKPIFNEQQTNSHTTAQGPQDPKDLRIKELEGTMEDLRQKLLYSQSERENMRRIRDQDVKNAQEYGLTNFAKTLLDVADNLGRCIENVPKEGLDQNTSLLLEGVLMTEKELIKIFNKHGIEKFHPILGEKFDPMRMNALMEVPPAQGTESGSIGVVLKPGYVLKGRVLRPADVGVVRSG